MKNAILLSIFLMISQFGNALTPDTPTGDNFKKTIILINGAPFLVEMDQSGKVVYNYILVNDYFASKESHDELVKKANTVYEKEMAMLNNSRLIIFDETSSILNEAAVNNIRDLANLYNSGVLQNINITAGHLEDENDEITVENRIGAISQLLQDFGVKEGDVSADVKIYRSDLPNQFVKIDLLK